VNLLVCGLLISGRSHTALRDRAAAFESQLADASVKLESARSKLGRRQRRLKETRQKISAADSQIEALERLRRELERDLAENEDQGSGVAAARAIGSDRRRWASGRDVDDSNTEDGTGSELTRDDDDDRDSQRSGVVLMNPHTGGTVRVSASGVSSGLLHTDHGDAGVLMSLASEELGRSGYVHGAEPAQPSVAPARQPHGPAHSSAPSSHAGSRLSSPGRDAASYHQQAGNTAAGRTTDPLGSSAGEGRARGEDGEAAGEGRGRREDGEAAGETESKVSDGAGSTEGIEWTRRSVDVSRVSAVSSLAGSRAVSSVIVPTGSGGRGLHTAGIAPPPGTPPAHTPDAALAAPALPSERVGGRPGDLPLQADADDEVVDDSDEAFDTDTQAEPEDDQGRI
jgi:hypothetical protein